MSVMVDCSFATTTINKWKFFIAVFCFIIASFLLGSRQLQAQSGSTLRVLITSNEDGVPVIGANVFLLNDDDDEIIKLGATNNDGFIEFRGIEAGDYQLKATFVGFKTYLEPLNIGSGQIKIQRISLFVQIETLDELVVEAERVVTTGDAGLHRISSEDIGRIPTPGLGGDLGSYLQTVPGVISSGDRGGELYIRGGTPSQNKVLVDNLPIIKPFHISNLFSAFPEDVVQSVDLYAGGFGAEYADATSAIIDVNLNPGNFKEFTGSGAVSPYIGSLQMEGPVKQGEQSFMFMARKSLIDQTAPQLTGDETPLDFYDVTGRYSFQGDEFTCNATGMYTYDNGKINDKRNSNFSWQNAVLGGRCLGFAESFNHPIEVTAGYSYFVNGEKSGDQAELNSSISQVFFKFDHEEFLLGLPIDYGLQLNFRTYNATLAERFTSIESFTDKQAAVNIYISTVWKPSKRLSIEPGITSIGTLTSTPTFEPRLRLAYRPGGRDDIEISAAAGRYYQTINSVSDVRDAGTVFKVYQPIERDLTIPSALHGILAYQQRFGNHFTVNLEGYVKKHQNISVTKWNPIAKVETETTLADGFAYGGDFQVEYNRNPFYFLLSYGYAQVEYEAASDDLGAWIERPVFSYHPRHDQRHKINSVLSYKIGGFTTNISWEFGSGQPYTQVYGFDLQLDVPRQEPLRNPGTARTLYSRPFGGRLPVYHRLDVSVERSFQLSPGVQLDTEAGAINLYDRDNIFYFDSNSLQRVNQTSLLPYVAVRAKFN